MLLPALVFGDVGYFDQPQNELIPKKEAPRWKPRGPHLSGKEIFEADDIWRHGDPYEIIREYKALLKKDPTYPMYLFRLGDAYRRIQEYSKAKKYLTKALQIYPRYTEAYISLGFTYLGMENGEEAYQQFEKARALQPDNIDAEYGLALSLIRLDRRKEAYKIFNDILQREPNNTEMMRRKANIDIYFRRYKRAYDQYQEIQKLAPSRGVEAKLFDIRQSFKPSHRFQVSASQELEKDLVTRVQTTRLGNILASFDSSFPVNEAFTFDTRSCSTVKINIT